MKRKVTLFTALMILGAAATAFAAEMDPKMIEFGLKFYIYTACAAGFSIAIAAFGTGLAQGISIRAAVEGTARNPEASGKILVNMMVGLALIESLCIYALVICLILIYANPGSAQVAKLLGLS